MSARILVATDLHQRAVLYAALIRLAAETKPDAIILGGDFPHGTCPLSTRTSELRFDRIVMA